MSEALMRQGSNTGELPRRLTDEAIAAVADNIRQFEKFKQAVLGPRDFTWLGDNQYIEKAGWVKVRMAMRASFEIFRNPTTGAPAGQRIVGHDNEGEYYVWVFGGRATTPDGVYIEMDGACSSRDDFFSLMKDEHGNTVRRPPSEIDEKDIIATAQTNCFNRCMSFLCGFGELSGEEVRGKQFAPRPGDRPVTFPFGDHKGKAPADLDLATLQKILPFWERQASDETNKFAAANKRIVAAIRAAMLAKQPPEPGPGDAGQPASPAPPAPGGPGSATVPPEIDQARREIEALKLERNITEAMVTVWCRKNKGVGYQELDLLGLQALAAWARTQGDA